jgi:integrase
VKGCVKQRSEGSWSVILYLGRDANGKKRQKWSTVHGTKKQAEAELTRLLHQMNTGNYVEPAKLTLSEYLDRWLQDYVEANLRPKTIQWYGYIIDRHIKPNLGHILLGRLTPTDLQKFYAQTRAGGRLNEDLKPSGEPVSASTVRGCHRTIHRALTQAVKWGLVARNVADAVDPPQTDKPPRQTLTAEQALAFLEVARESRYYVLYLAAISTGMRQGELLGLRWRDLDLQTGLARVSLQLGKPGPNMELAKVKTRRSVRPVVLPPTLVEALRELKDVQDAEKVACHGHYEDHDLVFTVPGGRPLHASNLTRRDFKPLLEKAKLPSIRFHDLRHTHATLLLGEGINPKIVSERLGHSAINITLDIYSHVLPNMQAEAALALDDALFKRPKTQAT